MVRLQAVDVGEDLTVEELLAELTTEVAELLGPPQTEQLDAPLGPVHRLVQRTNGERGTAVESVQYLWAFPAQQAALVLGTAFPDLLEAQRWRPALDALARSVQPAEVDA